MSFNHLRWQRRIVICREQSMPYAGRVSDVNMSRNSIENVKGVKHEITDETIQLRRSRFFTTEEADRVPALS